MANLRIEAQLVDGSLMPYIDENDSCAKAVEFICGDDLRPPPQSVTISVRTPGGKSLVVSIPNNKSGHVRITVEGDVI